jgi:preprotein translocase subunit SecG
MTRAFDIIIIAVLVIAIVMLITGNGEQLMSFFSSNKSESIYDVYEKEPFNKACLLFCIVMLINELALLFLGSMIPGLGLVTVGVTVAAFVGFILYTRKYRKK